MPDDIVQPQDPTRMNSPKVERAIDEPIDDTSGNDFADGGIVRARIVADDCYWNDKRYSDGGTVCDAGQRYKCWSGKWVDIGNC